MNAAAGDVRAGVLSGLVQVRMPSDSGDGSYLVRCIPGGTWTCSCPDHTCRHRECKHIMRVRRRLEEMRAAELREAG